MRPLKDTFSCEHPSSNALKHGYNTVGTKVFAAGKVWDLLFWVLDGRPDWKSGNRTWGLKSGPWIDSRVGWAKTPKMLKIKIVESNLRLQRPTLLLEHPSRKHHGHHYYKLQTIVLALGMVSLLLFSVLGGRPVRKIGKSKPEARYIMLM